MNNIVHVFVQCRNCDFETQNSFPEIKKMKAEAIKHSKETGHEVIIEIGTSVCYKGGKHYD